MNNLRKLLLFIFLISSFTVKGQFKIDTLSDVNIISNKIPAKPFFSTFSKRLFFRNQTFNFTRLNYKADSINEFIYPIVIQVENNTKHKIKLDSLLIKSTEIDTSKVLVYFEVFQSGKRVSISKLKIASREKKIKAMFFEKDTYLPIGTSYIGFTINCKIDFDLRFYVNYKINGYFHSYNKQRDEFHLLNTDDMSSIPTPQIKLFYTKLY